MSLRAPRPRSSFTKVLAGVTLGAVALVAGAVLAVRVEPRTAGQGVGAIVRRADRLMGERVTVTGRIGDVVSAKSFTLTEDNKRILVLDVSAVPAIDNNLNGVMRSERVQVTGVLERFAIEETESYVGELIDERYEPFVGEPVILVDAFTPR